jgi:hypothetical protein
MTNEQIINKIKDLGDKVFLNPTGPLVRIVIDKNKKLSELEYYKSDNLHEISEIFELSFDPTTYRTFRRKDITKSGPKELFGEVLNDEYIGEIIEKLKDIENENDLISIKDEIITELKENLKKNIKIDLEPYNTIGKTVDLFLEHLVSLCNKFDDNDRKKIIPLLFLPINSKIIEPNLIFSKEDIKEIKKECNKTTSMLKDKKKYLFIQNIIKDKANNLGINRIYFDLIWGERYLYEGNNFDELTQKVIFNKKNMDEKRKANSQIVTKILKATN